MLNFNLFAKKVRKMFGGYSQFVYICIVFKVENSALI